VTADRRKRTSPGNGRGPLCASVLHRHSLSPQRGQNLAQLRLMRVRQCGQWGMATLRPIATMTTTNSTLKPQQASMAET